MTDNRKSGQTAQGRGPSYNKDAVDKAIAASRPKIGAKEAKAIHALLKGRHPQPKPQ